MPPWTIGNSACGCQCGGYALQLRRAPREPAQASLARVARDALFALARDDVIELHDHVGAEVALDVHHRFRREDVLRSVDVAAKLDAVFAHGAQALEREHLKAARVGEDRPVPSHELMQPAEIANELVARPQMQMVRVAEDHLRADVVQVVRVERLHRRLGADRHERRRLDDAVRRREPSGARAADGLLELERKTSLWQSLP